MRSTPPRASSRSPFMSNRRYLKLVLPRFATRIFMRPFVRPSITELAPEDGRHHSQSAEDGTQDRHDQCVTLGGRVRAGNQTDNAKNERDGTATDTEDNQDHDVRVEEPVHKKPPIDQRGECRSATEGTVPPRRWRPKRRYLPRNISSTSRSGRGMTCALTSSPCADAAWAPASTAARTEPTSPRTNVVTNALPICTWPDSATFAALHIASVAAMVAM